MKILSIDLETYSPIDIKLGAYKYAEKSEIILFAYSVDYGPVVCLDLTKEGLPGWLCAALTSPHYKKKAFNASFERSQLNAFYSFYSPPEQWECTLARAAMCGLPLSLDDASKALGLIEKKDSAGKALIRYFSMPCKPTKANGMRTRNLPEHDPEKWQQFIEYCKQDIITEQAVEKACSWYKIPEQEHKLWCLNERKNERGIKVDVDLIDSAIILDKNYREELTEEAVSITGLSNVNSPAQLKKWLSAETEEELENLNKQTVTALLNGIGEGDAKRVLQIRQLMSRSSIKKYNGMKLAAGLDCRIRGLTQYYGANRTGREAGRIVNGQNFPRIQEWFQEIIDDTREIVKMRDIECLHMCFNNLSDVLSQLLRTTFIADKGKEFIVLDYSSVEAVCLANLADEEWLIKAFANKIDVYKMTAVNMFKIPFEQVSKDQRQKAKISFLLGQYGGAVPAMERMNDTIEDPKKRIPVKEMPGLIKAFREANANIVQLWWDTDSAAKTTIKTGENTPVRHSIVFGMKNGNLLMKLPSGRCIVYQKAHLRKFYIAHIPVDDKETETLKTYVNDKLVKEEYAKKITNVKIGEVHNQSMKEYQYYLNRAGLVDDGTKPAIRETVCFWGQNQTTKAWQVIETYGPKFCENFTQGICRDLLMHSIINIENAGFDIVLTVHDELVVEVLKGKTNLEEIKELMLDLPAYAKPWGIRAEGFTADYYQK